MVSTCLWGEDNGNTHIWNFSGLHPMCLLLTLRKIPTKEDSWWLIGLKFFLKNEFKYQFIELLSLLMFKFDHFWPLRAYLNWLLNSFDMTLVLFDSFAFWFHKIPGLPGIFLISDKESAISTGALSQVRFLEERLWVKYLHTSLLGTALRIIPVGVT